MRREGGETAISSAKHIQGPYVLLFPIPINPVMTAL